MNEMHAYQELLFYVLFSSPLWPIFTTMALYLVYLLFLYVFDIRNLVYVGLPMLSSRLQVSL